MEPVTPARGEAYLWPALLTRTRKRRTFRRSAPNGDALVPGVQTSSSSRPAQAVFYLNLSLVLEPWLRWLRKTNDPAALTDPKAEEGAVRGRVQVAPFNDKWMSTPDSATACGAAAAAAVTAALPAWLPFLGDRAALLAALESDTQLPGTAARLALRALLHQDLGHVAEAERELADITAFQPASPFAVWLEQRLDLA
jgi:hypothetical protein